MQIKELFTKQLDRPINGVVKAEHRHAADQQGDHAHQQIKGEQAATGAGEKRVSASGHSNSGEGTVGI